jgi:diguanylate cyclase (GGDEF)-like protein
MKRCANLRIVSVQELRGVDTAARFGGDEFVLILPQAYTDGAVIVAERLRKGHRKDRDSRGRSSGRIHRYRDISHKCRHAFRVGDRR